MLQAVPSRALLIALTFWEKRHRTGYQITDIPVSKVHKNALFHKKCKQFSG